MLTMLTIKINIVMFIIRASLVLGISEIVVVMIVITVITIALMMADIKNKLSCFTGQRFLP